MVEVSRYTVERAVVSDVVSVENKDREVMGTTNPADITLFEPGTIT